MLGASYPINKNVSVNAGYKLQGAFNDFEGSIGGTKLKVSYTNSNLLVGARYNF
jgi:opacity protein-like surface antigen